MDLLSFYVGPTSIEETRLVLEAFLEALTVANELYYRRFPKGPCCPGCAGIRYAEPSAGPQTFRSIECLYAHGIGACGELAAMVAGRHRSRGDRGTRVRVDVVDPRTREFHAVVVRGDGSMEDPTVELQDEQASGNDAARATVEPEQPVCSCGV